MYTRMVIPLDGSQVAEQVLPYARFLAKKLAIPVNLLQVIDPDTVALLANPEKGRYIDTIVHDIMESSRAYLKTIAQSIPGASVQCLVEKGKAEEVLIEHVAADKDSLMIMATHGRSGIQRWLLGSVADKVLHGATNHVLLIRAIGSTLRRRDEPVRNKLLPTAAGTGRQDLRARVRFQQIPARYQLSGQQCTACGFVENGLQINPPGHS